MIEATALRCVRHRRWVAATWLALLAGLIVLSVAAKGATHDDYTVTGVDSTRATQLMESAGLRSTAGKEATVVFHDAVGVTTPQVKQSVDAFLTGVRRQVPHVSISGPFQRRGARQVSADGTTAYARLYLAPRSAAQRDTAARTMRKLRAAEHTRGLEVALGGDIFAASSSGGPGEGLGVLAAAVILLVAFGSVLAAGLPLVVAAFGAGTGVAVVGVAANLIDMPSAATPVAGMLAVGVGIDYSLLIVTRYREQLGRGQMPETAAVAAMRSAGRSVLFAGTTVVVCVLGLLMMGFGLVNGIAIGAAAAVAMTMLAALTLMPALLGFTGTGIDRFGLPHRRRTTKPTDAAGFRWSRVVQRRPLVFAVVSLAALALLAVPALDLRLGFADAGTRPAGDTTRQAYDLMADGFGPGTNGPLLVAVDTPAGADQQSTAHQLSSLGDAIADAAGVASVAPPRTGDGAAVIAVTPRTGPGDPATSDLVHRLRDDVIPGSLAGTGMHAYVGGVTAAAVDYADFTGQRLPLFVVVILALAFLLLMMVFRSVVVPLKAVLMNVLTIGATFGTVVAVFQWGWGASLVGVDTVGPIEAWVPMMLVAIVFGLSMDYEVFLISRIREEYDAGRSNGEAVTHGLGHTGRVISSAAAIMICVFASFVLGDARDLKLFGFGLAVSVLVDATLVRLILVPASMDLLGERNWWLPRRLARILPRLTVEADDQDMQNPRSPETTAVSA